MSNLRRFGLSFGLILILATGAGGIRLADSAQAACVPPRTSLPGYYFDGWYQHPGGTLKSTESYISEYDPWVPNSAYDTSQWVMLVNTTTSSYAQIGWLKNYQRRMFVEANQSGIVSYWDYAPQPTNAWTKYEVTYNPGTGLFQFFWNNQLRATLYGYGGAPNEAQQFAELHDRRNQVPGGTGNHSLFTESWYRSSDSQHHYFNAVPAAGIPPTEPFAAKGTVGVWQLDVWDTACSS